jgi:TadE-like protein
MMKPDRETTHTGPAGFPAGRPPRANRGLRIRDERGQAVTEFAMVVPLFAALVIVCILFGKAIYDYIQLTHSANEAARLAAVDQPQNVTSLCSYLNGLGALPKGVTIWIRYPNPDAATNSQGAGEPVTIKAVASGSWVPIIGSTIDLSSSATMRIEQDTSTNPALTPPTPSSTAFQQLCAT